MYVEKFCRRVADDFKHKELLPLKMLFFVHASTVLVLYPYLTIHMRELGINVEETAIMSAVTPVVAIVMPPIAGIIADRIGNFKLMLALFSSLGGLAALLLLAVPVGRYTVKYPERVQLTVGCSGGALEAAWADQHPCRALPWAADLANLTLESCGVVCRGDLADRAQLNRTLRVAPRYSLRIADAAHSDTFTYGLSKDVRLLPAGGPGGPGGPGGGAPATPSAYFPTPGLHSLDCGPAAGVEGNASLRCSLGRDLVVGQGSPVDQPTTRRRLVALLSPTEAAAPSPLEQRWRLSSLDPRPDGGQGQPSRPRPATCSDAFIQGGRSAAVWLSDAEPPATAGGPGTAAGAETGARSPSSSLSRCVSGCLVSAARADFCANAQDVVEVDPSFTFWMYLVVRVLVGVVSGTSFAMFEGAVIALLREHDGDYGLQRIYASIGGMISSPLSGMLIDYASAGKSYTDFRPAFYLYAALKLASGILMLRINLEFKAPAKNVVGDVLQVLRNVEMVCLFIVCFLLGTAWGYIESFLFWLLQDLGASRSLMGVTVTVGGIAGIPLLVLSGPIIARLGHANVLFIGFVFYAVRLFGYSMIYNPWLCLVFEAMESFTSSLATTAAVTYGAALSTPSTDTSVQGLIGGLYYGVGKGAGSLIGGYLMKAVGTRNTYRVFAAGSLGAGFAYFLFNRFYLRHQRSGKEGMGLGGFGTTKKEKPPSSKDHEACVMAEITKDKSSSLEEAKDNAAVILNNKAADVVQQKNDRNSALVVQTPPAGAAGAQTQGGQGQTQAGQGPSEKAPLARVAALRDYSSGASLDTPPTAPTRRYSAHSTHSLATASSSPVPAAAGRRAEGLDGEDTVRRRKSTDCGLGAASRDE